MTKIRKITYSFFRLMSLHPVISFAAICLLSALVFDWSADKLTPLFLTVFFTSLFILVSLATYWAKNGKLDENRVVFLILAASFLVRLAYTQYTGLTVRQHDIGTFRSASYGHAGYIYRIYETGSIPDEIKSQFYHPPLHYIIEAVWLKILTVLGVAFDTAKHYVTVLTLFYASSSVYISYRIFKELNLKNKPLYIATAISAFHPAFIIASASYNNDTLAVMFMLLAVLYTFRWWNNPTFKNIIIIALALGCGMMSKLSAFYAAPAIAVVFAVKFFKDRHYLNKIAQFATFLGISVPLGTWWSFYMLIVAGKPLGYVMKLSSKLPQYIGDYSVADRLFGIIPSFSEGIYFARGEDFANSFYEYNIPSAVIKTSVFGEWHIGEGLALTEFAAKAVLVFNVFLIIISLLCMINTIFTRRTSAKPIFVGALFTFWLTVVGLYVKFCFDYAHNCTMDFRYIVPTVLIGSAFIGLYMQGDEEYDSDGVFAKYSKTVIAIITTAFAVSVSILYVISSYAVN